MSDLANTMQSMIDEEKDRYTDGAFWTFKHFSNKNVQELLNELETACQREAALVEALEKIAKRWFDPNEVEYVCSNCDGGLHMLAEHELEFHDRGCCYQIAKEALANFKGRAG